MKKLAILGASYLQWPLYEKAKQKSIVTLGLSSESSFSLADQYFSVSIREKEKILSICREENINGIISIASDIVVPTMTYISNNLGLVGNSINSSELSTNKLKMRNTLRGEEIAIPSFQQVSSVKEVISFRNSAGKNVIIKPVDRSGSLGVFKIDLSADEKIVEEKFNEALSYSFVKEVLVENFVSGREVSVEAISFKGKHYILAFTDKVTSGSPHFVELEHHQPAKLRSDERKDLSDLVFRSLNCLRMENGASHSEFIITEHNKIFVTEIATRMGGDFIGSDLVELSTGYDYLGATIDIALGDFTRPLFQKKEYSGIYFCHNSNPKVEGLIRSGQQRNGIVKKEMVKGAREILESSRDRCGYFIYRGKEKLTI